jgi:RHS repeat-associated protein
VVRTGTALEITVYIDGVYEHRYKGSTSGPLLDQQHQNNYFVMDGRSRIATVRLGHAWGDTAPDLCYNLEDHLGTSTTRLTDTGTVVDREEYYPFGDSCLRTIDKKRYRYVGKERDEESGLYYYGARYYAAWVGRFVSVDPLADEYKQLTPYNYAANNPIGDFDIDGQQNNQTAPDLPAGATITENHPLWNVPPALRGKVLTGPGSSAGVGEAAPSTVELPPLKLPAAARDATSTRGALDPIPSSLPLNEQGPLGNFKSGIVSSKPRPHQTIGPADDDPYHKELSQYYRRQYQFRQAIEAARARDPFAVGVAQGLIEAARHPEDVAAVIVPELILLRLQKAAQVYKLTKLAAAGVRAEEALVSTRLLTAGEHLPNAGGKIISFVQETDQIYYRVYSESSVGAFLTATPPRSGAWAREALSLPPGNEATFVQEVLVPAGTRLQRSRALPVPEWNRMHGGGEQFQLLGPHHLPKENFGLGQPLM